MHAHPQIVRKRKQATQRKQVGFSRDALCG